MMPEFGQRVHYVKMLQICVMLKIKDDETYHILGDSSYPLSNNLITPYRVRSNMTLAQKKFNMNLASKRGMTKWEMLCAYINARVWIHVKTYQTFELSWLFFLQTSQFPLKFQSLSVQFKSGFLECQHSIEFPSINLILLIPIFRSSGQSSFYQCNYRLSTYIFI